MRGSVSLPQPTWRSGPPSGQVVIPLLSLEFLIPQPTRRRALLSDLREGASATYAKVAGPGAHRLPSAVPGLDRPSRACPPPYCFSSRCCHPSSSSPHHVGC